MHSLKILISESHYKDLTQAKRDLKLNGFEGYTLSSIIAEMVRALYMMHPGANPPKQDHLLMDQDGNNWSSLMRRYIRITMDYETRHHIDQLFDCFSRPTSNSERIAAALEKHLVREPFWIQHLKND